MSQTTTIPKHFHPWLGFLLLLDSIGLGWAALVIFRVSSGSGRALAFGLSAQSLLLVGLTLLAALVFLTAGLLALRGNPSVPGFVDALLKRPAWSIGLLTVLFLACWLVAWTPAERFVGNYYYALRLIPLAGWLSFASGTGALFLLAAHRGISVDNLFAYLRHHRPAFMLAALALLLMLCAAWLASTRILNMNPQEEDYWYGAGVPVLAWQVLTAILIGLGAAWGGKIFLHNGTKDSVGRVPVDVLAFVITWVAAGILWAQVPPSANFMTTQPYPPNFEYYPASDGESYDVSSQYALVGQGLFNSGIMRAYFERPLYSAFLVYLHLLAGQNFTLLLAIQAAIYAVLPAIAYLLGKAIHSRAAGAALAALLTLRGINGLEAGGILDNSSQKMFLTDFPTAIGLALILLLAVRWAQNPQRDWRLAGWMGGCIGLWGFVRPHIALLLPVAVLLLVFVLYFRRKRMLAAISGFLVLAYLAATMPWIQFNGSGVSLAGMYLERIRAIIQERFYWSQPQPNGSLAPRQIASLDVYGGYAESPQKSAPQFALDHLLNNLALSTLALPTSLNNLELVTVIKQSETFWKPYWDGALSPSAKVLVPLNLALIALGIGAAWKRARFAGLIPLFGMLLYYFINSLARTSGGRYLVPADWVFVLYFTLGLATFFELVAAWFNSKLDIDPAPAQPVQANGGRPILQGLAILLILCGIGSAIPLAGSLHLQRYERLDKSQVAAKVEQKYLGQLGLSGEDMRVFLEQGQSVVMEGRALYPRYIWRGTNPLIPAHMLQAKPYSRTSFVILGQQGHQAFVLPTGDEWFPLPQAADVIILGCLTDEFYIDGWAIILEQSGEVHLRQPETNLTCPLPEPVCDNNGWCK